MNSGLVHQPCHPLDAGSDALRQQFFIESRRRYVLQDLFPTAAAFNPDEQSVIIGGPEGVIILYDLETGREVRRYLAHTHNVQHLAFSPDGSTFVSRAFNEPVISLWDTASGELLRTLAGHDGMVNGLIFSSDGRRLYSWSPDSTVIAWRMDTLDGLMTWVNENRYIRDLTCAEREQYNVLPLC